MKRITFYHVYTKRRARKLLPVLERHESRALGMKELVLELGFDGGNEIAKAILLLVPNLEVLNLSMQYDKDGEWEELKALTKLQVFKMSFHGDGINQTQYVVIQFELA
jgi:hypothetical protein